MWWLRERSIRYDPKIATERSQKIGQQNPAFFLPSLAASIHIHTKRNEKVNSPTFHFFFHIFLLCCACEQSSCDLTLPFSFFPFFFFSVDREFPPSAIPLLVVRKQKHEQCSTKTPNIQILLSSSMVSFSFFFLFNYHTDIFIQLFISCFMVVCFLFSLLCSFM